MGIAYISDVRQKWGWADWLKRSDGCAICDVQWKSRRESQADISNFRHQQRQHRVPERIKPSGQRLISLVYKKKTIQIVTVKRPWQQKHFRKWTQMRMAK